MWDYSRFPLEKYVQVPVPSTRRIYCRSNKNSASMKARDLKGDTLASTFNALCSVSAMAIRSDDEVELFRVYGLGHMAFSTPGSLSSNYIQILSCLRRPGRTRTIFHLVNICYCKYQKQHQYTLDVNSSLRGASISVRVQKVSATKHVLWVRCATLRPG